MLSLKVGLIGGKKMIKYVALLRGVNVGGKNKLDMKELKKAFEARGFLGVQTYINSGNVIFSSQSADEPALKAECEAVIRENFGLDIFVALMCASDLFDAVEHAPVWWNADENSKHNAIFVIAPMSVEEDFSAVGEIKPEYEKVDFYGRLIFWSAPLKTFSRTRWAKVSGNIVYNDLTIRNPNTVYKLAELLKGEN